MHALGRSEGERGGGGRGWGGGGEVVVVACYGLYHPACLSMHARPKCWSLLFKALLHCAGLIKDLCRALGEGSRACLGYQPDCLSYTARAECGV